MTATTFADLGVSDTVVSTLAERGIIEAFPIQAASIEASLAGRDICGKAPTGSGKTLAFGIPVIDLASKGKAWRPKALILAPTRELATQIKEELEALARANDRTIITAFGGTNIQRDIRRLEKGVDILVACPGRLEDLISRRCCELRDVDIVVVDEADRMADMGFLPAVKRILDQTNEDRHTLLFSATLDGDVDMLIKRYQHDPLTYEVEEQVGDIGDVEHSWYLIQPVDRIDSAVRILRSYYSSIVFCRTRRGCDRVAKMFVKRGLPAVAIHGDRSQSQRERALKDFTSGKAQVLVATDVAARGIHVDNVALVMHYDPAGTDKDYIHRSGRTGRAGQDGRVISMVVEDKKKVARQLQKQLGLKPGFDDLDMSALPDVVERPKYVEPKSKPSSDSGKGSRNRNDGDRDRGGRDRDRGKGGHSRDRGGRKRDGDRNRDDDRSRGDRDRGKGGSNSRNRKRDRDDDRNERGDRKSRSDRNERDDRKGGGGNGRGRSGNRYRDDDRPSGKPRRQRRRGANDWYPPGYDDDDKHSSGSRTGSSKKRSTGSSRDRDDDRRRDDDERPGGGRNTTKRKSRGAKGRHADKSSTKNKGKRRKPRR